MRNRDMQKLTCERKVRHDSYADAGAEAHRLEETVGEQFKVYFCTVCGGYHVAHRRKINNKRIGKRIYQQNREDDYSYASGE